MSHLAKSDQPLHARLQPLGAQHGFHIPVTGKRQRKTSASDECHLTAKERKAKKRKEVKTPVPEVPVAQALGSLSQSPKRSDYVHCNKEYKIKGKIVKP